MTRTLEHKVRRNAMIIYTIVALVFTGTIAYIYLLRKDINEQKENLQRYHADLTLTNLLIDKINETQQEATSYVNTRRTKHYTRFQENLSTVDLLVDSLRADTRDTMQLQVLREVNKLLKEKGKIMLKLNRQLNLPDYQKQLDAMKNSYEGQVGKDSAIIATTIKDTVIKAASQKGFWRRLSNVFSPHEDTVITKRVLRSDTVRVFTPDSLQLSDGLNELAEQLGTSYSNRVSDIEKQVRQLVNADHEISIKISRTLMLFYHQIVSQRLQEIRKSDRLVSMNSAYSLVGWAVALALILVFITLIIHDVNRSVSVRKLQEEANERVRQTMESRHRLLLSVSHDIKTPLNSILGYLDLRKISGRFSPEEVSSMEVAGKHILSLLENLLHFSGLEREKVRKEEHVFSLLSCCREIQQMFAPLLLKKALAFECRFDFPRDLYLKADELRIKQIIANLLSNAVKYTQKGQVSFLLEYRNNHLYIKINDTGSGIADEQMDKIFEPFSRLERHASMAEGAGFGLYVVKGLVKLLGGGISLVSEIDKGTSVTVKLPVSEAEVPPTDFLPKRVLLVDDDLTFLKVLQKMLLRLGHQAEVWDLTVDTIGAKSGVFDTYDMLLTDMEMGAFSGVDLLKEVRSHTRYLPVVVMTAQAGFDEEKARQLGFSAYLKKPVTMSALAQWLGGKESLDLQSLTELFDNDPQAIDEMLRLFVSSTGERLDLLRQALERDDFVAAGQLSHKMLPMFLQLGEEEASSLLKKVEEHRNRQLSEYPGWQEDIRLFIKTAERLIEQINAHYLDA